ncbi:MAG: hypothetical protein JST59_02720 [Actinobacteria bacterium]|nr:hypothetical protein [Actinomycetota bacterium]
MEFSKISTLRSSGIPQSYVDMHPAVTYEGDNTVLLQLTARQLLKSEQASSPKPGAIVDPRSIDSMMVAAAYVSDREVERIKECIGKALESGKDMESIWNEDLQRELVEVSKIWGYYTMIKHCSVVLKGTSPNYRPLYSKICMVFCGQLIMSIKRLPFYGLKFEPIDVMTVFSEEEKDVLFSIYDPFGLLEPYQLNSEYLDKKGSSMLRVAQQQLQAKL